MRSQEDIQLIKALQFTVESLQANFDALMKEYDAAHAEVEQLKQALEQAIAERTPHDYGILKEEVDYWKAETHRVAKKRDEALDDVEQLKQALFFLNKHRKAFIEEIMAFGYSKPSATKMAARITQTISFQCLRNL